MLFRVQKPSKDQLQVILGTILSKINGINSMIAYAKEGNGNLTMAISNMKTQFTTVEANSRQNITRYMTAQFKCIGTKSEKACNEYESLKYTAVDSLMTESQAFSNFQFVRDFDGSEDKYIEKLRKERDEYENKANRVRALIGDSSPYLDGIVDDSALSVANLTDANRDDSWLQFEYDSTATAGNAGIGTGGTKQADSSVTQRLYTYYALSLPSATVRHVNYDSNRYKSSLHFQRSVANSTVRVKGELLRVTIKRPWFKPELFENPQFSHVS